MYFCFISFFFFNFVNENCEREQSAIYNVNSLYLMGNFTTGSVQNSKTFIGYKMNKIKLRVFSFHDLIQLRLI